MSETIRELLAAGESDAPAIGAPGREALTYATLRADVERLAGQLRALGIGRNDRVAIVLPNGPAMAVTFLAVASCATAAPLNPNYREQEFRFYLDDLNAKALITRPADPAESLEAPAAAPDGAERLSLDGDAGALNLSLDGAAVRAVEAVDFAEADDIALVLHTSGTTSRPKIVPLSHRNLTTSAGNIMASLALTPEDRCLNVMPLFHIHGLMAAVLGSLAAGASVCCTPGFDAFRFFDWFAEWRPSWYTAVPTMHQLILQRASRHGDAIEANRLRFLRSSSASLPPSVMAELEETFGSPMVEAYGMTEASHQMAVNPLPPEARKPGSVGPGVGVEVAIMDEPGALQAKGVTGEVVIKGGNVTSGYESNPEANAGAFTDGWFRTGDQGYLDEDGYLFLTGRLKEIINRGGEKVSPREVDEILLEHPAVAQAVAFALPHDRLGEEVATAIVLAEGHEASERELRDYAGERLAPFKVPRKWVFVDEVPKGPTGKLQRIGLAEQLGLV
ncbi:MAG: acyl--CoA ligase [Dehalococcoidia bacterium]|jgi:acyl-CoA synthetase (AMP-forming)/AMP-acid ligase II|nr:acyl--CoA ligase [Dehalococcoidia bacterium]